MIADLHTHSTASDGTLSPAALVAAAAAAGVTLLSITDHDTVAAYAELPDALPAGLTLVPGIEFSAQWSRRGVHVVGLNIAPLSDALAAALEGQRRVRTERAERIAARLVRLGFDGALDGAARLAGSASIGRAHFARHLVERGAVGTFAEAFDRYLGNGKPAAVGERWPELASIVAHVRDAGGTAVLAHPAKYKLTHTKLDRLAREFRAAGGEALEVVSGRQVPALTRSLAALAAQHGLAASVGSDFHQPEQHWAALGRARLPAGCEPVWARFAA